MKLLNESLRRPSTPWIVTSLLLVMMLINFADKALLGLAAHDIMDEFGLSASQYGTVQSVFFLIFSIFALIGGIVSDRVPVKPLLIGMVLIWSVAQGILLLPLAGAGFWLLLSSRALLGAGEGPAFPIANRTAHAWFPDEARDLPTGILSIGAPLGIVLAAPALTILINNFGWRAAFVLMGLLGIVWAVAWARFGGLPAASTAGPAAGIRAAPLENSDSDIGYRRILLSRTWIGVVAGGLGAYWAQGIFVAWLPIYVSEVLGITGLAMGLVVAIPWTLMILALVLQGLCIRRMTVRGVSGRVARGFTTSGCLIVSGLCVAMTTVVTPNWARITLLSIALATVAVPNAIGPSLCSSISPSAKRGGVLGAFVALGSIAAVIAPYTAGHFIDAAGSYAAGFDNVFATTAALFITVGIVAGILIHPEHDRKRLTTGTAHRAPTSEAT